MKAIEKQAYHISLGKKYFNSNKYKLAGQEFYKALNIKENPEVYFELAKIEYVSGRYKKAEKMILKYISENEENLNGLEILAKIYKEQSKDEKAEKIFEKILKINPENSAPYLELGDIYLENGNIKKAEMKYKRAISLDPENWRSYSGLGMVCLKAGENSKAINFFKKAFEKKGSGSGSIYRNMAEALFNLKNWKKAIENYKKSIKLEPGDWNGFLGLGRTYLETGENHKAVEYFKKALEVGGEPGVVYRDLGISYFNMNEWVKAVGNYEKSLEYTPDDWRAFSGIGRVYLKSGENKKSIDFFNKALESGAEKSEIYQDLAAVYLNMNKLNKSIEKCKAVLDMDPEKSEIHTFLGRIYKRAGKLEQSIDCYERYLKMIEEVDDYSTYLELGDNYCKLKKWKKAILNYSKYLKYNPSNWKVRMKLGEIYGKIKKFDKAEKEFEICLKNAGKNIAHISNKALNEIDIMKGRVVLKSKPVSMRVTLTTRCNLNCTMCEIPRPVWDIPRKTLLEIESWFPYLEYIMWQGGEAFLYKGFEKIFDKAAVFPNLKQEINTNGILIDERWARKLVNSKANLVYSIDYVNKKGYEAIRRGAKYEDLLKSIELVNKYRSRSNADQKNEMNLNLHVVVMKSNYKHLKEFIEFAKDHNFQNLNFSPIEGKPGPENIFINKDPEIMKFIWGLIPVVEQKAQEYGITFNNYLPIYEEKSVQNNKEEDKNIDLDTDEKICYKPWRNLFIDPRCEVVPECICLKPIGDIHTHKLEELWNNEKMKLYRKKILQNKAKGLCNPDCLSGVRAETCLK